jgi:hypothetical protein
VEGLTLLGYVKKLTFYDFMAASILGIFIVWFWAQIAYYIPGFKDAPLGITILASYIFYTLGGIIVTYLAMKRSETEKIRDGLLIGGITSLSTSIYVTLIPGATLNIVAALFISYLLGGYLGTLLKIKITKPKEDFLNEEDSTEQNPEDMA